MSNKMKITGIVLAAAAIVGICAYGLIRYLPPAEQQPATIVEKLLLPTLAIAAEKDSAAGIEQNTGFIISANAPIDASELQQRLRIEPETAYTLHERSDTELFLQPAEALAADTIYNILVEENSYEPALSWAFQTKDSFKLAGFLPDDGSDYVPVESGIEFYFSQPVADIGQYITISPAVEGSYSQPNPKTVVFAPKGGLSFRTTYTVTLAANTPSLAGDTLGEAQSFSFTTRYSADAWGYGLRPFDGLAETFTTTDPIYIKLYADNALANADTEVSVYRYSGLDAYMAALQSGLADDSTFLPTEGLNKVAAFDAQLLMNPDVFWNVAFIQLPENPSTGWYLVDIHTKPGTQDAAGLQTQKLLQISDMAVYGQTTNNQLLLWLNDAAGGQAVAGAKISIAGRSAVSSADGVAVLDVSPQAEALRSSDYNYYHDYGYRLHELRVEHNGQQFGEYLEFLDYGEMPLNRQYYAYIYTDREAYLPDDTVRFWGTVLPRNSDTPLPKQLKLDWTDGGKYPEGIMVAVQPDGSFQGELQLEKHASGWETLDFYLNDKFLDSINITVTLYDKPVHVANISLDKDYYRKNDVIHTLLTAKFYDGTPARNLLFALRYQGGTAETNGDFHTDASGIITAEFNIAGQSDWHPRNDSIYASSSGAENYYISLGADALVFPSDYMLQGSLEWQDGGLQLALDSYAINFRAVDDGRYQQSRDVAVLRGPAAEMSGEATIYRVEYVRNKTGEYYDFINKVVVPQYDYDRVEKVVDTLPLQTVGGHYASPPLGYAQGERIYYYAKLSCQAPDGSQITDTFYAPGYRSYYYGNNENYKNYYFRQDSADDGSGNYDSYYYYDFSYASYGLYEPIEMRLTDSNNVEPQVGRLLYSVLGQELYSWQVVNGSRFNLEFLPKYIPNSSVVGAYFDGQHIFSVNSSTLDYREEESQLNIQLTPDRDQYSPGDTVELKLRITGPDGQGLPAKFLLSVADEAAFAEYEQHVDPLSTIYSNNYVDFIQYASYIQPYDIDYGAESGEGGDGGLRQDFLDTVAFISGQTDSQGQATVSFKLADNITSWRLTGIAYGNRFILTTDRQDPASFSVPYVGHTISNIPSTLPFFINEVLNQRYLAGDTIGISLRSAGIAISDADIVEYTVEVRGEDAGSEKYNKSLSAAAGEYCLLTFDPLPAGTYKVTIRAACDQYSDAIEKTITVADSLLLLERSQKGLLSEGVNISAERFPVELLLYDMDNRLYYDILYSLLYSYGNRADQAVGRAVAQQRLHEADAANPAATLDIDTEEAANWQYGLRIYPYAQTDALLTAKALVVGGEFLNKPALARYFEGIIQNKDAEAMEVAAAYMGLSALKKPVLLDIRQMLADAAQNSAFGLEEQMYLATGLALLGDHDTARTWYNANLHQALRQNNSGAYYDGAANDYDNYRITAGAATLACLIKHNDHRLLLGYLTENSSTTYAPLLELATYISKYSPRPTEQAKLSYKLNGSIIEHIFADNKPLHLELGETQLAEADITALEGNIGYAAYYTGSLEEAQLKLPTGVGITHHVEKESLKLGETTLVNTTITFDGDAPLANYQFSQIVPTGLRFIGVNNHDWQSGWYYHVGEAGTIDFYVHPKYKYTGDSIYGEREMPASVTFTYEARAVLPGTYIMEASALTYSGSNELYAGQRRTITVTE